MEESKDINCGTQGKDLAKNLPSTRKPSAVEPGCPSSLPLNLGCVAESPGGVTSPGALVTYSPDQCNLDNRGRTS